MTKKLIAKIRRSLKAHNSRGAWANGVKAYALELLDEYEDALYYRRDDEKITEKALLNGASDWQEYSDGGCSLIDDGDICERLCNNTEKKLTRNGERRPNSRENWLDVQARALFQASMLLRRIAARCY